MTGTGQESLEKMAQERLERLDVACDRFEAALRTGQHPRIADYLSDVAETERSTWLRELLSLEVDWRLRHGEKPAPADYLDEFPEDWQTIETAFIAARTPPPGSNCSPAPESATELNAGPMTGSPSVGQTSSWLRREPDSPDLPTVDKDADRVAFKGSDDPIGWLIQEGALDRSSQPGVAGRIGRFEILGVLGQGGMGVVLTARDPHTRDRVAIKLLRPDMIQGSAELFSQEAWQMSRLDHPNILPILETGEKAKWPYYVMPQVGGGPLSKLISGQPLDGRRTLEIARQIAAAVDDTHRHGLTHRDIKPSNILIGEDDRAYLSDFGLARSLEHDPLFDPLHPHRVGTVPYMSPAVARGEIEDTRCDTYSFGAVLREMLTGRKPYAGQSTDDILRQVTTGPPEPILKIHPHAHPGLTRVAEGCMERELRDRYTSMKDVVDDLDRVARGEDPQGPHGQPPRRYPAVKRLVAGLCLVASLVLLARLSLPGPFSHRLAAGDLDPTFGNGGKVVTDLASGSEDGGCKLLIQPLDGKILAVGRCARPGGKAFAVVRYTRVGALDPKFGNRGVALADFNAECDANGAALQADGKIVVVGNQLQSGTGQDFAVLRFTPDGKLDAGFGPGGKVHTDLGADDYAVGVALQPDGRILVCGNSGPPGCRDFALARYNGDGSLDQRFGKDGVVLANLSDTGTSDDSATCVAIQPDGRILVAGLSDRFGSYDFTIVRFHPDGRRDGSFGSGGMAQADFGDRDEPWAIALQPDGRILLGGFSWREHAEGSIGFETQGIKLARFTAEGSLDPSFGNGGLAAPSLAGSPRSFDLALQPDGRIVVPVSLYRASPNRFDPKTKGMVSKPYVTPPPLPGYDFAVIRLNPDGSPDDRFGNRGAVLTVLDSQVNSGRHSVALQHDGKILAGTTANISGSRDFTVLRYLGSEQRVARWW